MIRSVPVLDPGALPWCRDEIGARASRSLAHGHAHESLCHPFGAQAANHTLFDTREARFETWTDCVILV